MMSLQGLPDAGLSFKFPHWSLETSSTDTAGRGTIDCTIEAERDRWSQDLDDLSDYDEAPDLEEHRARPACPQVLCWNPASRKICKNL